MPNCPRPPLVQFERRGLPVGGVESGSDPLRPGLDGRGVAGLRQRPVQLDRDGAEVDLP